MNEEQRNGESGEKPELSRSCKGSPPAAVLSQRGRQTMNRARVPFDFIIKRLARHEPDGRWENFSHFSLAVPFMMSVIFMDGRVPGRKEEGTRWGFLIRQ